METEKELINKLKVEVFDILAEQNMLNNEINRLEEIKNKKLQELNKLTKVNKEE